MFGPILVQRWHTIFCSLTCSCRSTKHNKQRRSCSCLEVAVLFCKCAHVVGPYLERKLRISIMTLSSDSSLVLLHPNILSFYICLYIFHEKFTFSTRMQKHMQPQNAMHTCALKDTLRKSWCKTLTLDEIPLSAFNGFSVRWCHIPSSAFKVCLLRVSPPHSLPAFNFAVIFWGFVCRWGCESFALSREQETRAAIVRLTALGSAALIHRRNSCRSLFFFFFFFFQTIRFSLSLSPSRAVPAYGKASAKTSKQKFLIQASNERSKTASTEVFFFFFLILNKKTLQNVHWL